MSNQDSTIDVVTATRMQWWTFEEQSPLARSLRRMRDEPRLRLRVAAGNVRGLPEIYNARIAAADAGDLLVFLHDDIWLDDFFFAQRIIEGLEHFDVIGVAGTRHRWPNQPAWCYSRAWDREKIGVTSGSILHGDDENPQFFGPTPAACELLDGVLLAARRSTLLEHDLRFDPQFPFHFYDLDFCRAARTKGLRLGTWPIAINHKSVGAFGGETWDGLYKAYLGKWGD